MSPSTAKMRLDRLLANLGYGARRDIKALAKAGRITLDGAPVRDGDAQIALAADLPARLLIDRVPLDPLPGLVLVMHKPLGITCSHKDQGPLVYDLLPARWRRRTPPLSTIGRLDKDTSGLLLLTDDGLLLHRAIAPRSKVTKRYRVTLARPLEGHEADAFAAGTLMLDGEEKPLQPVAMELTGEGSAENPVVLVTLMEGRYHQVRRMFAALGNHVTALHRDRFGGLALPQDLAPGEYRAVTPDEIDDIFT